MSRPRPWWETYPRKYWTAGDWRAARKAGAVPPLPKAEVDQPIRPLVPQGQPEVAMSLYGDPSRNRDAERRRKVDALLEARGVRPRPL